MIEIKNIEVFGLERALRASGNIYSIGEINTSKFFEPKDSERSIKMANVEMGRGHDHFLSGITVVFDMKFNSYWLLEAQRYHWFNIISAQSACQSITYLATNENFLKMFNKYVDSESIEKIKMYIDAYNIAVTNGEPTYDWFMRAISNLPMGFEAWMTVSTSYLQLKTMYFQKRSAKLEEDWKVFCTMCDKLPMFKELVDQ